MANERAIVTTGWVIVPLEGEEFEYWPEVLRDYEVDGSANVTRGPYESLIPDPNQINMEIKAQTEVMDLIAVDLKYTILDGTRVNLDEVPEDEAEPLSFKESAAYARTQAARRRRKLEKTGREFRAYGRGIDPDDIPGQSWLDGLRQAFAIKRDFNGVRTWTDSQLDAAGLDDVDGRTVREIYLEYNEYARSAPRQPSRRRREQG